MNIKNKELKRRIIEISYKHKLAHLGSCLTAVDIIKEIYDTKGKDEKFILSSGHAGLALYVVLEEQGGRNAEEIFEHHGVHPDRCGECGISVSTGSLGQGLPIAVGMALSDRNKNVYCLISDGEFAEGSIFEALRISENLKLNNLHIYQNNNGYAAYQSTIEYRGIFNLHFENINFHKILTTNEFHFLNGLDAHYKVMNEEEYDQAMEILK